MPRDSVIRLRVLNVLLDLVNVAVSRRDKGMELLVDEQHGGAIHGRIAVDRSSDAVELDTETLSQMLDGMDIRRARGAVP